MGTQHQWNGYGIGFRRGIYPKSIGQFDKGGEMLVGYGRIGIKDGTGTASWLSLRSACNIQPKRC